MIAIISDLHLGEPVGRWSTARRLAGRYDTSHADRASRIVEKINRHSETLHTIVCGDITDRTMDRELAEAEDVLGDLEGEVDVVPGNHDVSSRWKQGIGYSRDGHEAMRRTVNAISGRPIRYPYLRDCGTYRLIFLDSSAHHESGTLFARGRIGDEQIAFLQMALSRQVPTYVVMHHYPAPVSPVLAVSDADDLLKVCARDHVTILNGHRHREGEYTRTGQRPRILTHGKCVDDLRVRILDPETGDFWWL